MEQCAADKFRNINFHFPPLVVEKAQVCHLDRMAVKRASDMRAIVLHLLEFGGMQNIPDQHDKLSLQFVLFCLLHSLSFIA